MEDPSNVRLLRIGLDLWPSKDLLVLVLTRLQPYTTSNRAGRPQRWVAWYCLAEIFRAAATETGIVEDSEALPDAIDIAAYRNRLYEEAVRLAVLPARLLPWYLRQQVMLFLAVFAPSTREQERPKGQGIYEDILLYLSGEFRSGNAGYFATVSILVRRAFSTRDKACALTLPWMNRSRPEQIALRDPAFALEMLTLKPEFCKLLPPRIQQDLCVSKRIPPVGWISLPDLVFDHERKGIIRNELSLLTFSSMFLALLPSLRQMSVISPEQVLLSLEETPTGGYDIREIRVVPERVVDGVSMYCPPQWSDPQDYWRFQLGYLLRFILAGEPDFTKIGRRASWREISYGYRIPYSHWYERFYGLYNEHSAFGDDWLPISEWIENLLSALLCMPGCRNWVLVEWTFAGADQAREEIELRRKHLSKIQGGSSGCLILPVKMPRLKKLKTARPLRACVMQTVIPADCDFQSSDLTLSGPSIRMRHRRHLSAALAAVERMLDLRETHKGSEGRLDWLILPELAVHPSDIQTHLVPFCRKHKTIILTGITYERPAPGALLVNSAYWIYPSWSRMAGLQVLVRRQGKKHLSSEEQQFNAPVPRLQGFRPCQWLLGYEWSSRSDDRALWLTAFCMLRCDRPWVGSRS